MYVLHCTFWFIHTFNYISANLGVYAGFLQSMHEYKYTCALHPWIFGGDNIMLWYYIFVASVPCGRHFSWCCNYGVLAAYARYILH